LGNKKKVTVYLPLEVYKRLNSYLFNQSMRDGKPFRGRIHEVVVEALEDWLNRRGNKIDQKEKAQKET